MNLSFEIINGGKGYKIKKDGVDWYVQDIFSPYPGATIEESAQNHINEILKESEAQVSTVDELNAIKKENNELRNSLADLWEVVLLGGM